LLNSILNKKIKEKDVLEEINKLNYENKKMIIEHVVNIDHPDFINDIIPKSNNIFKIIDILSKEIYYREEIIKKFKKIGKREYLREPISIVKSLEVFTKEDFFIILNKKSCINFFLLNCLKFNYTKEEKENLKEIFPDYYFIDSQLSIENIIEIREKSSLFNIFPEIYKKNGIDKNNFNFFVKNIKNIKDEELKCSIVFNFFFGFLNYEQKLNNELYLDFF